MSDVRKDEFEKVKEILRDRIDDAPFGLFFTRNVINDPMDTIYVGKAFTVDICLPYGYFEVFGCFKGEEDELVRYYEKLKKEYIDREDK